MRRAFVGVSLVLGLGVGFAAGARPGPVQEPSAVPCPHHCDIYCESQGKTWTGCTPQGSCICS